MKFFITVLALLLLNLASLDSQAKSDIQLLRVFKSERRLELVNHSNEVVKTYRIMLGKNPIGHKVKEGDNKTPEGTYTLDEKNPASNFNKSFHISYPNLKDKLKARALGVSPGGEIMLHGFPNDFKEMTSWLDVVGLAELGDDLIRASLTNFDWTSGCIAVSDEEINEIYQLVDVPTKIVIRP
jgi:murein L,D-transpeptidase YafK